MQICVSAKLPGSNGGCPLLPKKSSFSWIKSIERMRLSKWWSVKGIFFQLFLFCGTVLRYTQQNEGVWHQFHFDTLQKCYVPLCPPKRVLRVYIYIYMYLSKSKWLITYHTLPSVLTQNKTSKLPEPSDIQTFFVCFNLSHWKPLRYHHRGFCKTWKISWDTKGQPQKGPNETL